MGKSIKNEKLEREMRLRGWGPDKLAERVGVEARTVRNWLNGVTKPQPEFSTKLCEIFGKNAEELGLMGGPSSAEPGINIEEGEKQNRITKPQQGNVAIHKRYLKGGILAAVTFGLVILIVGGSLLVFAYKERSTLITISPRLRSHPIYSDNFIDSNPLIEKARQKAQWKIASYCAFLADGFHIIDLYEKSHHACMANNLPITNPDFSVDEKINHGSYVTFFLRSKAPPNHFITGYYILINIDGKYSIQAHLDDAPEHNKQIVPWTFPPSKSLHPGVGVWNTVRIKLQDSIISLWFNSTGKSQPDFIGTLPLPTINGIIGFGATATNHKSPLDAVFKNLAIYDLGK